MNDIRAIRSPFFYVGDKYKLMPQLRRLMPRNIIRYIEPFVGGGSSFLNTNALLYYLNDIDSNVINLHKELIRYGNSGHLFINKIFKIINDYDLSCSYLGKSAPAELKKEYPKTYFAQMNKIGYKKLKEDYNNDKNDMLKLYVLLIYGFNHMIRFNKKGDFNLPVGNVDFNKNVYQALLSYFELVNKRCIVLKNQDYISFLESIKLQDKDYIYFDPPYLISLSEYNKFWNIDREIELCYYLDFLHKKGIKFGITNLVTHKDRTNTIFWDWSRKYKTYGIESNYISYYDNSIKDTSKEVFVTNYG